MALPFYAAIENTFDALGRLAMAISAYSEENAVSAHVSYQLDLAVEELITNIIKYGYDDERLHTITVDITKSDDGAVTLCICDDGHFFNPTEIANSRRSATNDFNELPVGGWGLSLVRQNARLFTYERRGEHNQTTVVFAPDATDDKEGAGKGGKSAT